VWGCDWCGGVRDFVLECMWGMSGCLVLGCCFGLYFGVVLARSITAYSFDCDLPMMFSFDYIFFEFD
jgi:hypothetical protein